MDVSGAPFRIRWAALFGLWTLQGAAALGAFWASRSSSFDLSFGESLLAGVLLCWIFLNLFLILSLLRRSAWLERLLTFVCAPAGRDGVFSFSVFAFFLLAGLFVFQSIADAEAFRAAGYLRLLLPLLVLAAATLAETAALILFFAFRRNFDNKESLKAFAAKLLFALVFLGSTFFYIARSRMGMDPIHQGDWAVGIPAVPFLEWQILLAVFVCAAAVLIESRLRLFRVPRPDFWIAFSIWAFAAALWLSQPVIPNSSALEPLAPNFEIYPFNDAQTYDEFAQSVLIGGGFRGNAIPQRPLYVLFLVFLHLFAGQDYAAMIALQSLVFAFFPVLLYFLGREFWGRPLGFSMALLAILRDYTSNLVSPFTGNLSYSKVYLSEIPTAMTLALFLLLGVRWIKSGFPLFRGFVLGGILGIAMLIRTQAAAAFPVLLLFAGLYWRNGGFSRLVKSALLALAALLLVVSPWLWRNWRLTGAPIFDSPESQTINLALRYSRLNGVEPQALPLPGESSREYNERLQRIAREAIVSNPGGAFRGVASSFLNHAINNLLLFPLRNDLKTPAELWTPSHAFWEEWDGKPTPSQTVLLLFYLFLLGLGIAALWRRGGLLGLLPLALNFAYNLWTSLALLSGQRFMLAMDWSVSMYYAAGLFALISAFLFTLEGGRAVIVEWFRNNPVSSVVESAAPVRWIRFLFAAVLFLGTGLALPLAERAFPPRYPEIPQSEIGRALLESPALRDFEYSACLKQILERGAASLLRGRALYPRYYEAGGGEPFTDSFGYKKTDESRLVFTLMGGGEISPRIVFPMKEAPTFFPHASDVTLLYGADGGLWLALVEAEQTEMAYLSSRFDPALCGK